MVVKCCAQIEGHCCLYFQITFLFLVASERTERTVTAISEPKAIFKPLLIPLFSLISYSTLDSHRNTVISHVVMASKTMTRSSLLQCATVSEGVFNRVIENNASDTLSLTDLKGHVSLRRSRISQIVITEMKCINDQGKANSFFVNLIPCVI